MFDIKKLEWMNGQHLQRIPLEALAARVAVAIEAAGFSSVTDLNARPEWTALLVDLLRIRSRTVDDIVRQSQPYFGTSVAYDEQATAKQWKDAALSRTLLAGARAALATLEPWDATAVEPALRILAEAHGVGAGSSSSRCASPSQAWQRARASSTCCSSSAATARSRGSTRPSRIRDSRRDSLMTILGLPQATGTCDISARLTFQHRAGALRVPARLSRRARISRACARSVAR